MGELLDTTAAALLHTMNLTWCPALTDAVASAIAEKCPKLNWLSYFGNTNISSVAIKKLAEGPCGPSLQRLDVRGLTQAPEYSGSVQNLKMAFPALVEWELHQ